MRRIASVLIILIIIAWPAELQENLIETRERRKDIPQTQSESKELREKTLAALELSYTNLREIIKIGYETHPEEFVTTSNSFHDALSYFPSFRNDHPYTIPYLKITHNAQGEITIVEAEEQPQKQDKDDIEGKGEDIPPEVHAPYPEADQRRRICKISNIVWSP